MAAPSSDSSLSTTSQATVDVELFRGETSLGITSTDANGQWRLPISDLGIRSHPLTAKALSGNKPVSSTWTIEVVAQAAPSLTSVFDSKGEVANGGRTNDTSLTVSGRAEPRQQVAVYDGNTLKNTVSVDSSGGWTLSMTGLALGAHSFKAVASYGEGVSSAIWTLTIEEAIPPFVLDESPVTLSATLYVLANNGGVNPVAPVYPTGSTITRSATGGKQPYTYTSSNNAVVNVNAAGLASPLANGSATITVRDSAGQSKSYSITVRSVWTTEHIGRFIHNGAVEYQRPGGHLSNLSELRVIGDQHRGHWPGSIPNTHYWSNEAASGLGKPFWGLNPVSGAGQTFLSAVPVETFSVYPRNA